MELAYWLGAGLGAAMLWTLFVVFVTRILVIRYERDQMRQAQHLIGKLQRRFEAMQWFAECLLTDALGKGVYKLGSEDIQFHVLLNTDGTIGVRDDVHGAFDTTSLRFTHAPLMRVDDPTTMNTLRRDLRIVKAPTR